ncbi:hypothetical protein A5780_05995 [Nocardia sp. 852002-20019_SCH5090214]|uniref:PucR family transcriptional regulator n=1 Tax=Nocardia sp. 852002-20019_SCH5090214 TaxID=1834087 RepID=UPI0007EA17CD|nr:helix-turn-helix domain-containing protein [Nocardia sp. 852002-20019_SCH5090214]OBA42113.1 hypothetical protein A5780_05995 [Nocardia sp. 852002-20019_SCH5090214]
MPRSVPDSLIVPIANGLTGRLDELTDDLVDRIVEEIEIYREPGVVPRAELRRSTRSNLEYMLHRLAHGRTLELRAPRSTGRERAGQGAPLPEVLRAFRLGSAFLWQRLLDSARASGQCSLDALLNVATDIWAMADDYSTALTESYRAAVGEAMILADRRRSALVAALLNGPSDENHTAWEIAKLLDMPYDGSFLVVVAETPELGRPALPGLEERLRALDVASAWRAGPEHEIVILSCGRRRTDEIRSLIAKFASARVGMSPPYSRLDRTPRALRFAKIAVETFEPDATGVRQLPDTPMAELVMGNLDTTRRFVRRVLGRVLTMADDDRSTLLTTAEAWLNARSSAAEAGRALYCHENTVRYRMRRLEERLDGELDDPATVAELAAALQAIRTFPELGARLTPDPHEDTNHP